MKSTLFSFFLFLVLGFGVAFAEVSAPVIMTQSESGFAPVVGGATTVDIPFTVSSYETMVFRIIAPVDGASLTLVSPSGAVAIAANSQLIHFTSGSGLTPPKPGGIFTTDSISTPANGVWKLRFTFPPATQDTFILATWLGHSAYESGIIADSDQYLTGETGLFGYLVTNLGQPIAGLSPTITITPLDGGAPISQIGKDDGLTIDGKANDGLYSGSQIFPTAGKYKVAGSVSIKTPSGLVARTAETRFEVVDPLISITSSSVTPKMDPAKGCAIGITVDLTMEVSVAGTYIIRGDLKASNGKTLSIGDSFTLSVGTQTIAFLFPIDRVRENIGTASSYIVTGVQGYKIDPAIATVRAFDVSNIGSYSGSLCVDAISFMPGVTTKEAMQGQLISSLTFGFQVVIQEAGAYYVTLQVVGPNGELIELVSLTTNLLAGNNEVTFAIPGKKFAAINGPYRVVSVVVDGNNQVATAVEIGQTKSYLMSQFVGFAQPALSSVPIPAVSTWGLALLSLMLIGIATMRTRKR